MKNIIKFYKRGSIEILYGKSTHTLYMYTIICIKENLRKVFNDTHYDDYYFNVDTIDEVVKKCRDFINDGDEKRFIEYLYQLITKNIHTSLKNKNEKIEDEMIKNVCFCSSGG